MRVTGCERCDGLWEQYQEAVMNHTRLSSKLKLTKLRYEQRVQELERQMDAAQEERNRLKAAILTHEKEAHPETEPSFFGASHS